MMLSIIIPIFVTQLQGRIVLRSSFPVKVTRSKQKADSGLCVLRYASRFSVMNEIRFTNDSFRKDGHKGILADYSEFTYDDLATMRLRRDCLHLVCTLSEKYSTVLQNDPAGCNDPKCSAGCCSGNNYCTVITDSDDVSVGDERPYHDEDTEAETMSVTSNESGSVFVPDSDEDIEIDSSDALYDVTIENSPCYEGDTERNEDDNDEDSSVEEVYSDYQTGPNEMKDGGIHDDPDTLICPGDRVEYRESKKGKSIKRSDVVTIEDSDETTFISLQNGKVLYPHKHDVRKVKSFDTVSRKHISNPLGEWFNVSKCMLQSGTTLDMDQTHNSGNESSEALEDEPEPDPT
jgi:hypothetical protein